MPGTGAIPPVELPQLPRSLVEDIAARLGDAIFEGRLAPGRQIVETDLQRELGISRAPLREALLKMEGQGLVRIIPRRGIYVRVLDPRRIREIFTVRAWMEGLAARLTAENGATECCGRMEEILSDMAALARRKRFKEYFYRHWDFHHVFQEGSRNEELSSRIATLRRESLWLSYSVTYFAHYHAQSQKTHRRILELFRVGDPEAVERAVRAHILGAAESYVRFWKETYPELDGSA
jgi:DNA-binding GntR family transcriptional regulator